MRIINGIVYELKSSTILAKNYADKNKLEVSSGFGIFPREVCVTENDEFFEVTYSGTTSVINVPMVDLKDDEKPKVVPLRTDTLEKLDGGFYISPLSKEEATNKINLCPHVSPIVKEWYIGEKPLEEISREKSS